MKSFQFLRKTSQAGTTMSSASRSAMNSGFHDSRPLRPKADTQGWFDSSADLKGGLQVQEDDFDSLPAELRDAFPSR